MRFQLVIAAIVSASAVSGTVAAATQVDAQLQQPAIATPSWFASIQAALLSNRFADARSLIDSQLKESSEARDQAALHSLRAFADVGEHDAAAFKKDHAEALRLAPDQAKVLPAFITAAVQIDPETSLSDFRQLEQIDPSAARALSPEMVSAVVNILSQSGRKELHDRFILELANVSYRPVWSSDSYQEEAARILLDKGDRNKAFQYAEQLTSRGSLKDVLTDRRYQPIWPAIEQASGDRLEVTARTQKAIAEADFKSDPDSVVLRLRLMRADADLGLLSEGDTLGAQVATTHDQLMALDPTTAPIIDAHAGILELLGRQAEADARYASFLATWSADRRWVINQAINYLFELVRNHRYQQVLDQLDRPGNRYEEDSSPYAKQLLRVLRAESLHDLGRHSDVQALIPDLMSHRDDAPARTMEALILIGEDAAAEQVALKYLDDPERREDILRALRVGDNSRFDDPVSEQIRRKLRSRPAIAAAFDKYGRDLPVNLRRSY